MKIKTIEQQIIEKADKELRDRIGKETSYIHNNIGWHEEWTWTPTDRLLNPLTAKAGPCLELLKGHLFERLKDSNRQKAIDAFLRKVDMVIQAADELGVYREEAQ